MSNPFHHLHMSSEVACEFLAVFSRFEYALKATITFADGDDRGVEAAWDRFANSIDDKFRAITDETFVRAVDYLWTNPPRKQVIDGGALSFIPVAIDTKQAKAQQVLIMVRRVRNNLFHGGKHLPNGEVETGRNAALVAGSLTVLKHSVTLDENVRIRFEY